MAIRSRVYYWLECTNRIDNIVAGECGTRSPVTGATRMRWSRSRSSGAG